MGHSAYGVKDLDASLHFYCVQLGLKKAFELSHDDGTLWIVYIYVGNGAFIELFPEKMVAEARDVSYKHLCLVVDDMNRTVADMGKTGLKPINPPSVGKDGNTQAWVQDPDGNFIELMQIAADSDQARAVAAL
jgi:lactoylglutathione lyase